MDTTERWAHRQPQIEGEKPSFTAVAFKPDGTKVIACTGQRILMFKTADGTLLKSLKGHTDNVYSLSFSRDGTQFASGGADSSAVIWSEEGKGVVKYSHTDSVQVVAFNPVQDILASCSNSDFGFWSPKERSVVKHKLESKALSAAWSNDGQILAIGMLTGIVTLRDLRGHEQMSIIRMAPAWCLDWCPSGTCADDADVLAVGCWDRTLSFYHASGVQVANEQHLDYFPCSLTYSNHTSLAVGGSNKAVSLFSSDGAALCTLATQGDWVWAATGHYRSGSIVATDHSGCVSLHSFRVPSVHALCGDLLAWCETATELRLQHLLSRRVDTIECGGIIQAVCFRGKRFVIKLPSSIMLCELSPDNRGTLCREIETLSIDPFGGMIALVSTGILICRGKKVEMLDLHGSQVQEWVFESEVGCIRAHGGPDGNECVLVGLEDGGFHIIYGCTSFPTFILSHTGAIAEVAINAARTHLAIVDEKNSLYLYELVSKEMLFREDGITSIAFNEEEDNLLCYGGCGVITIRALQDNVYTRTIDGDVVGFRGSRIFLYNENAVEEVDVGLSTLVRQLMGSNRFHEAYCIANAGVSDSVWTELANGAIDALQLKVARESFLRIQDHSLLELIESTETKLVQQGGDPVSLGIVEHNFRANVALIRCQYHEAAEQFAKAGEPQKSVDLFVDLHLWDEAKSFATAADLDLAGVLLKHASWAEESGDWKVASELYLDAQEYLKAIGLIGQMKQDGWGQSLLGIARKLSVTDVAALQKCADYLVESVDEYAQEILEVYKKVGNFEGYMAVCVQTQRWSEAEAIYKDHEDEFRGCPSVLPYAEWLVMQERFEDAFSVYHRAENVEQGWRLVFELVRNAIIEGRLKDASFYHWVLAKEATRDAPSGVETPQTNYSDKSYQHHRLMSQLYYAYHMVQDFCDESFTRLHPEALFQLTAFLINAVSATGAPDGISLVRVLHTFAKHARQIGAFQSARYAYQQMQLLRVPVDMAQDVDFDTLTIQAEPTGDNPDLLAVCYRCGSTCSVLRRQHDSHAGGEGTDSCTNCGHPFLRCGINFDALSLVEFVPEETISDQDAMVMIEAGEPSGHDEEDEHDEDEAFTEAINSSLTRQESSLEYLPTAADEATLRSLRREDVFALGAVGDTEADSRQGRRARFFKNVIPDIGIAACRHCHHFFHEQDYELAALENGRRCILCRQPLQNYGHL